MSTQNNKKKNNKELDMNISGIMTEKENENKEKVVLLHEYRLEQLEENNAKRYSEILEQLRDNKKVLADTQKELVEHTLRIEEVEHRQENFDSYIKSIAVIVLAEIIMEALKYMHP